MDVLVKIARVPAHNPWLQREAQTLQRFIDERFLQPLGKTVAGLHDSFLLADGTKRFAVTVLRHRPALVSLEQVLRAHPKGLEPDDALWICRRVIAQPLAALMAGLVHGALVPPHLLVDPIKREPVVLGWPHARPTGERITHLIPSYKAYYPPEILHRQPADHRSDIYMAGKCMIALNGGDVHRNTLPKTLAEPVRRLILACVAMEPKKRPQNAKVFLTDFTAAVRKAYGQTYRPLIVSAT